MHCKLGMGTRPLIPLFCLLFHKDSLSPGPFLVCAPLSTVPNWLREFGTWAPSLNVIAYAGCAEARQVSEYLDVYDRFSTYLLLFLSYLFSPCLAEILLLSI